MITGRDDLHQGEVRKLGSQEHVRVTPDRAHHSRESWAGRILKRAGAILHRKQAGSGWNGLLELEESGSPEERRLLLIRGFTHLAGDALAGNPANRRSWPSEARINALHAAASSLLACAIDQNAAYPVETGRGTATENDALVAAIRTLLGYLALQQALQQSPVLDPEPMRLLAREHTRLRIAFNETTEWLRSS